MGPQTGFWLIGFALSIPALSAEYEIVGELAPPGKAMVAIYGATTPFASTTSSSTRGHFRFQKLAAGTYVVAVNELARGEIRQTIEVGPGTADSKRRVKTIVRMERGRFENGRGSRGATISARELAVPAEASRYFGEALRLLERRDVAAAVEDLNTAVKIAPAFMAAWNQLGTIAYQSGRYTESERCFRNALDADPDAFEPLVNLGGVLLNLAKPAEALEFNLRAVARHANDALANSQLGMSYLATGNLEMAGKYLTIAKQIDPGHFSNPQLLLAEIDLRRNEPEAAITELEDFLKRHPDAPNGTGVRDTIARLKQGHD